MFNSSNKIIIVDDTEQDLMTLAKVFLSSGVGCKTILYDGAYDTPLQGVRVAFFDIKVLGKSFNINQAVFDYKTDRDLSAVFNDLAYALRSCIHPDNGPYALIFWSSNVTVISNFIEYIRDVDKGYSDLPSPILVDAIDKSTFLGRTPDEIKEKINGIFNGKSIKLLFDFENNCNNSASQIVDEIYKIIPKNSNVADQIWCSNVGFEDNFDIIFSKIASQTLGIEHAKKHVDRAVAEALLPALNYNVLNNSLVEKNWEGFLKSINNRTLNYPPDFKHGILNTIFHLDHVTEVTFDTRGAVYEYILEVPFMEKVINGLGLGKYFEFMETTSNELFSKFFLFKDGVSDQVKNFVKANAHFIVIEISSSCDFAQNKSRNNKFVLGLLLPKFDFDSIDFDKISNSVFYKDLPELWLDGKEFSIWVNFNFVMSSFSKNKNFGKPLFILKKELMDMIGNRYANHVSRIGITSF